MSKTSLFFAAALAITLGTASAAQAAEKISIMVGGIEKNIYLPAKLAEQLGYFKDEGLDVELLSEPAGVDAENEMLAGAVQGVVGFYDHTSICRPRASSSNRWSSSARRRARWSWSRPRWPTRSSRRPISRARTSA